jgi:hypothetical protein
MVAAAASRRNTLLNGYGSRVAAPAADMAALTERIRSYAVGQGWRLFPTTGQDCAGLGLTPAQRDACAEAMWDDEAVKTGVLQKCFGVMPLTLQTLPADPASAADRDAAEFCRWAVENLDEGVPGLIWSLLHCLRGHVVCEPVWRTKPGTDRPQLEDRGPWAGKHALAAVKAKPKSSYRLEVDDYSTPLGVTADGAFLPRTRDGEPGVVILSYLPRYESPWGTSDYDAAIRLWAFKTTAWRLRRLYLDRLVGPYLIGKTAGAFDQNGQASAKAAALFTLLQAARSCGVIVIEPGDAVEAKDLAGSSDDQFSRGIQDANAAIIMNFTGAYLHTMEGKNPDARGNAAVSRDVTEGHQWYLRDRVQAALSKQVFPLLTRRNFAGAGFPKAVLEVINPAYAQAMLGILETAKKNGVPTSLKQWRSVAAAMAPADAADTVPGDAAPPKMPLMVPGQGPPPPLPLPGQTGPDGRPVPHADGGKPADQGDGGATDGRPTK